MNTATDLYLRTKRGRMNALVKSSEWKQQWRSRIGGGRSAAAAGIHEYVTPLELYLSMVEGTDIDPETKPDMLRGLLLEPVALQRLEMLYTELDFTPHDQDDFIRNTNYYWASDLPDFWVSCDGIRIPGQIKVPAPRNWEKLDESIPDYIQCNCVHSAAMNNAPAILLACLNPVTMQIYRQIYEPKQDAIDALMEAEERFFNEHIVPRIPPPPQTHDDLKLRWPEAAVGTRINASAEIEEDMHLLVAAKLQEKEAKAEIEDISLRVKTFMEDREALVSEGGRTIATYKSRLDTVLDGKLLKAERPEVWSAFSKHRPVRTFLVKAKNH